MCGIYGCYRPGGLAEDAALDLLQGMGDRLRHRGPDDRGGWLDAPRGIALGHTRLSILDLSQAGHQPIASASDRYRLSFNGEIYNHRELRRELEQGGTRFHGHSDTETLVEAVAAWGMPGVLGRLNGMFAFAVWDRATERLYLARDRFGEKPLYYGWVGDSFLFASELPAMRAHPAFRGSVDPVALGDYLASGFLTGDRSIYAGVRQLPPAHWGELAVPERVLCATPYWDAQAVIADGLATPLSYRAGDTEDQVLGTLRAAVALRMEADVPLGAFLSGGLDSSLVVALMQEQSAGVVQSFSVGFEARTYNELEHAGRVAAQLGTRHTPIVVTEAEAMAVIPDLPAMYGEPFADVSAVPTSLIARLARRYVTVSLTGDAGDELFGGYNRHVVAQRLAKVLGHTPGPVRRLAAAGLRTLPAGLLARRPGASASLGWGSAADKLEKMAALVAAGDGMPGYAALVAGRRPAGGQPSEQFGFYPSELPGAGPAEHFMALDTLNYLPGDVLVKVDRSAMAVGLETRIPYLDPVLFALAWRLPAQCRISGGQGKRILRTLLARYVPPTLTDRPKMGFSVPLAQWLRDGLRDWAETLLAADRLRVSGLLDVDAVRRTWAEHLSGVRDLEQSLWAVLMFQAWLGDQHARA